MYEKAKKSWLKHLDFLIIDLICIEIAYALSFELRYLWFHRSVESFWELNPWSNPLHQQVAVFLAMSHLMMALSRGVYKNILRRGYFEEAKYVLFHNVFVFVTLNIFLYAIKEGGDFSRASFFFTWGISCVLMYVIHLLWKNVVRHHMENDENLPGIMVVVTSEIAKKVVKNLLDHHYNGFHVVGIAVLENAPVEMDVPGIMVVTGEEAMYGFVRENVVDEVLISGEITEEKQKELVEHFLMMGQTVHIDLNRDDEDYPNKMVQRIGNMTVLTSSIKSVEGYQVFAKRLLDILGGIIGCILTLVVSIIICPIIKLQSPGPLFFSQVRIGKNGRKFRIYKFRSMYTDAEEHKAELMKLNEMQGLMFKMENDPRIFPAGHFIRKYSIDELPQFINVLKGDMSLVGTRPPTVEEYEKYELHHRVRLSIKPGMTGMWQISGRNSIKDFEQVVALDEQYIRNWNFGLDIKIIFKTIQVVLTARGAM